jgi:hypothetical protein
MRAGHAIDGEACAVVLVVLMFWLTVGVLCAMVFWG